MQFLFDLEYSDHEDPDKTFEGACSKRNVYWRFIYKLIVICWRVVDCYKINALCYRNYTNRLLALQDTIRLSWQMLQLSVN